MHCYRDGTDEWFKFCGVTSPGHGKHYPHEVLTRDGSHPIMKTLGPGWYSPAGELYHIQKLWPTATALAAAKNQENGKDEVCVWVNEYNKTRVFGSTLGHHNETVSHPAYLDLITRGVLWSADKLNDSYLKPVRPQLVPVNLALNKKGTASSEEKGKNNFAKNAFDGNGGTRWCAAGPTKDEWLQVDLGKAEKITGVEIDWEGDGAVYAYKLETSADGKTWEALFDGAKNDKPSPNRHEAAREKVQHVRVTYLGSSTGAWGSIKELRVHGTEMVTLAPRDAGKQAEQALLKEVKVPAGFEAQIFAAPPVVNYPVCVAAAVNGDVYVSADKNGSLGRNPNAGSVLRVRDLDGDGRADEVKRYIANIDSPRGLVWDHDRLYLMHPPHLSAFIDKDGDGISDEQKILVKNIAFDLKARPADHTSNGVTLGIDGWLYLAIGDFGFMEAEGADGKKLQLRGGGVVRVRPDGTGLELYTRGTRNILEASLDPLMNGFSRDNTNDGGGWDIRLHHYSGLEDHGYPRRYMHFNDEVVQPLADYGGGSGCGGLFLSEPGFPAGMGNSLFTCDWGRSVVYRHPLTAKGASFTAGQEEFATVNRVTDMDVDGSSRLYLASWKNGGFSYSDENIGYIARVVPTGYQPEKLPDFAKATLAELVQLITSPSHRRRIEAQRMLLRRDVDKDSALALAAIGRDAKHSLEVRVAAVLTLSQASSPHVVPLLVELNALAELQEYVLRGLADRPDAAKTAPAAIFSAATKSELPRVRLQAAVGIARLNLTAAAADIVPLLNDIDPIVAHTAVQSLILLQASDACFQAIDQKDASPNVRVGALRVVQELHEPKIVAAVSERLKQEPDAERRAGLFSALCRLYYREGAWKGDSWGTRPDTSGPYYSRETWEQSEAILATLQTAIDKADGPEAAKAFVELARHHIRLNAGIDKLLSLAKNDAKLLPVIAAELAKQTDVPASAVPLLVEATKTDVPAVRANAVVALVKANQAESLPAIFTALDALDNKRRGQKEWDQARDALLNAAALENHLDAIATTASKLNGEAVWADAVLLSLLSKGSVEGKAKAQLVLDAGWNEPARRMQIIRAVQTSRQLLYRAKVVAALTDADAKVADVAKKIAAEMKFDKSPFPITGPKIATLKPEEAVEAAINEKGDVAYGEEIFLRLQCTKCHTTKASEAPRGPFLGTIASTYKRKDLVEAVLLPSKTLAQGFVTNQFVLDDGRVLVGFVTKEAADQVTIRDAEAKEHVIPVTSIEERKKQTISVMPDGLAKELTLKEFASLIDYLQSLPKK